MGVEYTSLLIVETHGLTGEPRSSLVGFGHLSGVHVS